MTDEKSLGTRPEDIVSLEILIKRRPASVGTDLGGPLLYGSLFTLVGHMACF